jgi:hydroxymethylglutaryl-CoA lyase
VPQLADAEAVLRGLRPRPGVTYTVLVPNERGLERALAAGARSIALFTAASDAFSRKNTGRAVEESLAALLPVAARAAEEGLGLRAYISTAFVCPYQGRIGPGAVIAVLRALRGMGVANVSVADTIGAADPAMVGRLLEAIAASDAAAPGSASPLDGIALHLHDTSRRALANALVGLEYGIAEFDSSAGGLGGCPFAPGAAGNLDTELLAGTLHAMGIATGLDLERHRQAAARIRAALEKAPPAPKP